MKLKEKQLDVCARVNREVMRAAEMNAQGVICDAHHMSE